MRKLGCIIRPQTTAFHASLAIEATQLQSSWSRIIGTPRIGKSNMKVGDCACVAAVMAVQTKLAERGNDTPISEDMALQIYSSVTGYVPGDESTDQGTDPESQLFPWWKENSICGYKLTNFTPINPKNIASLQNSIFRNGGVYLCVSVSSENMQAVESVPASQEPEFNPIGIPGSAGGHAIFADDYEADYLQCTSWGEALRIKQSYLTGGFGNAAYSLELKLS